VTQYPYQIISANPTVPPAPILRVTLLYPDQTRDRRYELDAFLDTGADATLIPLEAVSVLRLPLLDERVPVMGVGGAITRGFLCKTAIQLGPIGLPLINVIACQAAAIGGQNQMIVGRDILNRCCMRFDGRRRIFSFEVD
jgi:predicted aspartyl protease